MKRRTITKEDPFTGLAKKGRVFNYLTFGSNEGEDYMGSMFENVEKFKQKLEEEAPENLIFKFRLYEGNTHFTNAIVTYIDGLALYFDLMQSE